MEIINIVGCAIPEREVLIDLDAISKVLYPNALLIETNSVRSIIWRRRIKKRSRQMTTETVVRMFKSGKIVCAGARTEREMRGAIEKFLKTLEMIGVVLPEYVIKVENIVVYESLGFRIDLELLALKLSKCVYEPDQFPALIYRAGGTTFLIFNNGKLIVSGGKLEEDIKRDIEEIKMMILECQKEQL